MSYSTLIGINRRSEWKGRPCETADLIDIQEMRNSWGTAPAIWSAAWRKYVSPEGSWLNDKALRVLCSLAKSEDEGVMPAHSAAMLRFCFDRGVVMNGQYARFAQDVRKWLADFPPLEGNANHWPRIAEIFESDPPYDAIGLYATSVAESPFILFIHTEQEDGENEWRPVDLASCHDVYADASRVLTCAFCGQKYPQGTPASGVQVLIDHIQVCEKHPLHQAEADRQRLLEAAFEVVDCRELGELRAMREVLPGMIAMGMGDKSALTLVDAVIAVLEVQP